MVDLFLSNMENGSVLPVLHACAAQSRAVINAIVLFNKQARCTPLSSWPRTPAVHENARRGRLLMGSLLSPRVRQERSHLTRGVAACASRRPAIGVPREEHVAHVELEEREVQPYRHAVVDDA